MRVVSALCLLIGCAGSLHAASLVAADQAVITKKGTAWTLENDVLKTAISFTNGSIDMTSFYNKAAATDHLTGGGTRCLFSHVVNGSTISATDGGWTFVSGTITNISLYGKSWGKQLSVTVSRTSPVNMSITLVSEIYNGPAGLRYSTFLKNNSDAEETVESSDVIALNFPNSAHTLWWVLGGAGMSWLSTTGSPGNPDRCCFTIYGTGDGWSLNPENNVRTSLAPGGGNADISHPFMHINAWTGIPGVKVYNQDRLGAAGTCSAASGHPAPGSGCSTTPS